MGVIGGIYHFDKKSVDKCEIDGIMKNIEKYSFDSEDSWLEGNVFLACCHKFITPESVNEKLPLVIKEAQIVITADAIIDNRSELFDLLSVPFNRRAEMVDSYIIFLAYEKWGQDCPKYLIGDYAFALWDGRKQTLFCARDAMGKRTFYYTNTNGTFAFSTLIKPILSLPQISNKLNDVWIADFLAIYIGGYELDPTLTVYENVKQLPPAHSLTLTPSGINIKQYWKLTHKELKLKSDAEYEELFLETYKEAVRCRMRSIRPVGVMMSGGLDSGSVACLAANELKEKGQRLKCFSHVPLEGKRDWLPKNAMGDETPFIEAIKNFNGNMDVTYVRCEHKNSYNVIDNLLDICEQPYHFIMNSYWLEGIAEVAESEGIGVLLDGASGNGTISWGLYMPHLISLIEHNKFNSLYYEAKVYADSKNKYLPKLLISLFKDFLPDNLLKLIYLLRGGIDYNREMSLINPFFENSMGIKKRMDRYGKDLSPYRIHSSEYIKSKLNGVKFLSMVGAVEAKHSLAYSLTKRDPTRDKRIVDLCMSIPDFQYVRSGMDRRLLRIVTKEILPDEVRMNSEIRGEQAVDSIERILKIYPSIKKELMEFSEMLFANKYVDIQKLKNVVDFLDMETSLSLEKECKVEMIIKGLIFYKFINKHI